MNPIGKITVMPAPPARIARLSELAYNLYWSWTPRAQQLFEDLNPALWERVGHSPLRTLMEISQAELDRAAADPEYLARFDAEMSAFDAYMNASETWFSRQNAATQGKIGYFSMEFGFAESLPIYSGGLGVLAGDHTKSASDLGLPFVAVGLLFHQGYFRQLLNGDGWQEEAYDTLNFQALPITPATGPDGREVRVRLGLPGRDVWIKVWKLQVGRVPVYLLDTDLQENRPDDRGLTARLYGGNQEMRIAQELVLGVGGVRALRALGEDIRVYHMNEGHAAFLGLERIREIMQTGQLNFWEALEAVSASNIFTTHTPVSAGNDAFPLNLVDLYLGKWYGLFGISHDDFINLARHDQPWGPTFSMTVLALRTSRAANGVSELHGDVSRRMWKFLFPGADADEVPIGHVTNGAHNLTFLSQKLRDLYTTVLPQDWTERVHEPELWEAVDQIPDAELGRVMHDLKVDMISFVRARLREQYRRHGAPAERIASADRVLDTHALTIGFARRFATYKRATLLFRDLERLKRIVNAAGRPVQFVFAGKAHPADNPGKEFIQSIYRFAQDPDLAGKIVILENYDLNVARHLVQGVDIWLNNPRRPLEASGTSGMKASFNGGLNFSILDGWWREGYDGVNGFAIGEEREYPSLEAQDDADAFSLYETLEKVIVPLYYARDEHGARHEWMLRTRAAIKTVSPRFSMNRQVIDYTRQYYLPVFRRGQQVIAEDYRVARELAAWKSQVKAAWPSVTLEAFSEMPAQARPGAQITVHARVHTAGIDPRFLRVEGVLRLEGADTAAVRTPLRFVTLSEGHWAEFSGELALPESGTYLVGARVLPYREELSNLLELGLIKWA
ncbi:starch phosphorylase [Deinobacterium chartae]|uniref:Starch phosphorylase n=1 Tax=Deinobacterium chartae TaxID=521158 RepID=A0A841I0I2_9DEIO|nr:alpha-glucan family phosphorylase [Deinobacterium chartae]MBB6097950.1 starch phosphorylase [Deinobacterium chartae]